MERHFDQDLDQIRRDLFSMAGRVEDMVSKALKSLTSRDSDLARELAEDDRFVDALELSIDEDCTRFLLRRDPKAGDLRLLLCTMKIVNDLERIGDSARNMGLSAIELNSQPPLKPYVDIPRLALLAQSMVRGALDALVRRDAPLAREIILRDDEADALYEQLFRELATFMIEDPTTVTRSLNLLLFARNLERVADHATNIAENVIFYLEAKDIRHTLAQSKPEPP